MYVCMYVCNKFKILALFSVIHVAMVMIEILPLTYMLWFNFILWFNF